MGLVARDPDRQVYTLHRVIFFIYVGYLIGHNLRMRINRDGNVKMNDLLSMINTNMMITMIVDTDI